MDQRATIRAAPDGLPGWGSKFLGPQGLYRAEPAALDHCSPLGGAPKSSIAAIIHCFLAAEEAVLGLVSLQKTAISHRWTLVHVVIGAF